MTLRVLMSSSIRPTRRWSLRQFERARQDIGAGDLGVASTDHGAVPTVTLWARRLLAIRLIT